MFYPHTTCCGTGAERWRGHLPTTEGELVRTSFRRSARCLCYRPLAQPVEACSDLPHAMCRSWDRSLPCVFVSARCRDHPRRRRFHRGKRSATQAAALALSPHQRRSQSSHTVIPERSPIFMNHNAISHIVMFNTPTPSYSKCNYYRKKCIHIFYIRSYISLPIMPMFFNTPPPPWPCIASLFHTLESYTNVNSLDPKLCSQLI